MNMQEITLAEAIRRSLRRQMWAIIGVCLALVGVTFFLWYEIKVQTDRSTGALCALRQDLERRVASSQDFLAANPHGIPGIPAALLQKSIADQQRSIVALSGLTCPPAAP